jgi:hypothetical protein
MAEPEKQPFAGQRPCKQATKPEPSLGNESAGDSGRIVGGGVFYVVRAEAPPLLFYLGLLPFRRC